MYPLDFKFYFYKLNNKKMSPYGAILILCQFSQYKKSKENLTLHHMGKILSVNLLG